MDSINGINQAGNECISSTQANIIYNERLFRREIVYWGRVFFNSVFANIGSEEEVFARYYYTPSAYLYTLRFILSRKVTEEIEGRYQRYIILIREIVGSALRGDAEGAEAGVAQLYMNVGERAQSLSEIFPDLDKEVLEEMLGRITQYELEQINAYIAQDHSRLIELTDNIIAQADKTSDYVASGIIKRITAAPVPGSIAEGRSSTNQPVCVTPAELDIMLDIATFWIELVTWYRAYRVSIMAGIGDEEELHNRLIRETEDFGDLLKTFVDAEVADTQVRLVQEYLLIMDQHLRARAEGNVDEMNRLYRLAVENIEERAAFYDASFPGLDAEEWRNHLLKLHSTLIDMGGEFLAGNYAQNILIFNSLINLAEDMGLHFLDALIATDPLTTEYINHFDIDTRYL